MRYFALVYHVAADYLERRGAFREEHLALAWAAHDRGELLIGGAFTDPPDTALLVWRCEDRATVEAFVAGDPYVRNGLVARHEIRDYRAVIADEPMPLADTPEAIEAARRDQLLRRSVDELELSVRAANALQTAGIRYIGELVQRTEAQLPAAIAREVAGVVAALGLELGMTLDSWPGPRPLR